MPRPSAWNSPTTAIRVPEHAVAAVMAVARQLDAAPPAEGFVQNNPVLMTIEDRGEVARYLLPPAPAVSAAESAQIEADIDWLMAQIAAAVPAPQQQDAALYVLSRLVEATVEPLPSNP